MATIMTKMKKLPNGATEIPKEESASRLSSLPATRRLWQAAPDEEVALLEENEFCFKTVKAEKKNSFFKKRSQCHASEMR